MPANLSPEDSVKIPTPKSADEINDLFKEVDDAKEITEKKEPKELKEPKESKEIEEPEIEEDDELELKEPEEDDVEKLDLNKDDQIDVPPRKKEILKEYPELFKKFPFLEKMMYRDKEYTNLFGSYDDAKEVAEKAETFSNFENQLLSGKTEDILREVKNADEKAFNLIVDDYLPTLAKVDKEAYFTVVGNLNKRLIMEMVQEAKDTNNEDLQQAALLVNQFIFGTSKFTAPTLRVDKNADKSAEENEAEKERLEFARERFETARDDLQTRIDNTLRATISEYIDPKGNMSSYVKKNAIADAIRFLSSAIASDSTTVKNLDKLWRASFENKFSKDSLGKIQSFYLSRARANLKNAILKARAEALKDTSPKSEKVEEEEVQPKVENARRVAPGRPSQTKGKNDMKKGESVTDFFMRD